MFEYCPHCDKETEHDEEFFPSPEFEDELDLMLLCKECENLKE